MLLLPLLPIFTTQVLQAVLFQLILRAKLIPVYKKDPDSVHDRNNYRPISILPIISKPLEFTWQNRISGTSLQTILFIETSRLVDHTIRVRLRS